MPKLHILKLLLVLLLVYLLYILVTCTLVPIFGSRAPIQSQALHMETSSPGTERVLCIDDNTEALLWRLRVIESAKEEIVLSSFEFDDDHSGRDMISTLKQAADRGVHVEILLDGLRGQLSMMQSVHFRALAAHENVEIKLYNPLNLMRPWEINYRMHDKCLVADNQVYILGGRNTMDLFLGDYQKLKNTDRDLLVYSTTPGKASSLQQVKDYFHTSWALPCNHLCTFRHTSKMDRAEEELDAHYESLKATYPTVFETTDWSGATLPVNGIMLLSNPQEAKNKEPQLWEQACRAMAQGDTAIIQTPYIICSRQMYGDLEQLTGNGTQVQIITNAVEAGANPFGCTDYLNQKKRILKTGAEVFEYIEDHSLHSKAILIDDRYSLIGSFNMDMRSAYLDTETMLLIDSPEINAYLREGIEEDMTHSIHVLPDGTETVGERYEPAPDSFFRDVCYTILRVIILPIRHLL